jgi:N-acyl amino acid synthase of PEP-CTERM/exosortase system
MSQNPLCQSSGTDADISPRSRPARRKFSTLCIDDDPALLAESYRLRYLVYCVEREFLRAADYPDGLETDEFDRYAKHLGTFDSAGRMVGTVRLVFPSILGLPLFRHCAVFPHETALYDPRNAVVEVSRLSVSRQHRPRRYWNQKKGQTVHLDTAHRHNDTVVFSLYRELYQVSKKAGLTHWIVATEASLQRAVADYGFPFRLIGPEIDYFGPVAPYLMDLSDFDRVIVSRTRPKLEGFPDGLDEPNKPGLEARPGIAAGIWARSDAE